MEANPAPGLPLGPQTQTQTHHPRGYNSSRVLVNPNQRGNKMLDSILKVPWEYADIGADYQVGRDAVALFLRCAYHRLKPEYIYTRMKTLAHALRIVLCVVDVEDHQQPIRELTRACIVAGYTLVLAWSLEEAGRYVETFKAFEFKSPDLIKEKVVGDAFTKVSECLVQIKSVNKTDALTLVSTFGTFRSIVQATPDELSTLPGFGDQKVRI
ncbi:restriction endonuclease type II-like protein [Chytriomyces sp. MP71]|nr:restriction endonuclease type II-like protein [Chytriomyces sp. MP71]